MRVKLTITADDLRASYRSYLRRDPRWAAAWKGQSRNGKYWAVAAIGATWVWILLARDQVRHGDGLDGPLLAFAAALVYLWWAASRWMRYTFDRYVEDNANAMIRAPESRYHEGEHELEVLADRVVFQGSHHRLEMAWSAVHRIDDEPGHVLIVRRDRATCIVPKRCLRDAAEAAQLVRLSREYHAAAGADIGSRLGPLLHRDVPCKSCGYNLRGTSSSTCPECAADLAPVLTELTGAL